MTLRRSGGRYVGSSPRCFATAVGPFVQVSSASNCFRQPLLPCVSGLRASEGYCLPADGLANPACAVMHALRDQFLLQLDQVPTQLFIIPSAVRDLCQRLLEPPAPAAQLHQALGKLLQGVSGLTVHPCVKGRFFDAMTRNWNNFAEVRATRSPRSISPRSPPACWATVLMKPDRFDPLADFAEHPPARTEAGILRGHPVGQTNAPCGTLAQRGPPSAEVPGWAAAAASACPRSLYGIRSFTCRGWLFPPRPGVESMFMNPPRRAPTVDELQNGLFRISSAGRALVVRVLRVQHLADFVACPVFPRSTDFEIIWCGSAGAGGEARGR